MQSVEGDKQKEGGRRRRQGWGMARKGAEEGPAVRGVWSEPDSRFLPRRWTAMEHSVH